MFDKIPLYVYIIFVFLLFLWIYYTKDRKTTYKKTFIFPLVFSVFAIYGIAIFWCNYYNLFFIVGIFLWYCLWKFFWKKGNFSFEDDLIHTKWSFIPLVYMLWIFIVKFIFWFLQARFPGIIDIPYFLLSVNVIYWIFLWIILKRMIIIQKLYKINQKH